MRGRALPLPFRVAAPCRYAFGIEREPLLELLQGIEFRVARTMGLLRRRVDRAPQRAGLGCFPERGQVLESLDRFQVEGIG